MNLALIAAAVCVVGAVLVPPPAQANDEVPLTQWGVCHVSEVATFANRVHVRCLLPAMAVYFAVPTSSSAEATRLVALGTAALISGRPLSIEAKFFVSSSDGYESWGCMSHDCRRALAVVLPK
jgi:hypothetical protein